MVVGYGVQKKESSVAAIEQVKGDDLVRSSTSNITSALTGQIPGVTTVQGTGQPGADDAKIYIRGISSWQGSDPLVTVDGVERSYNDIDPNEIESISVLKDASATAIFGVRGANGVILITTKRGSKGDVKVNFTSELTLKQPIEVVPTMDSYSTALVLNQAYKNDNNWGALLSDEVLEHYRTQDMPYLYPNTNWQDIMLKDVGFGHKYNVNISGGSDFARVFASLSYMNDGDIINTQKHELFDPTYKYDRFNYRFNIDLDLTKTTLLSVDAGGYIGTRNSPYESSLQRAFRSILFLGPMDIPAYYEPEVLELYPDDAHPEETGRRLASTGKPNAESPVIANSYSGSRTIRTTNLNVTMKLDQKLDFITEGLKFTGKVAYNNVNAYESTIAYEAIAYRLGTDGIWTRYRGRDGENGELPEQWPDVSTEGLQDNNNNPLRTYYYEASLNYGRTFGRHSVTGLVVGQRRQVAKNVAFPSYEQGLAFRATYDFDHRYLFEANLGYNGSEQFAPENRYGVFPSFAVGYNLHNEKFWKPLSKIMSKAKIRASWGKVGSDAAPNRWLYTSSYVNGNTGSNYTPGTPTDAGTTITSIVEEAAANTSAQWEVATKQDLGFELGFLNNMFTLNMDFYQEKRDKILLSRLSIPSWAGASSKAANLGATETKGYELDLKYQQHLRSGLFLWARGSLSFSDNRITARDEPMYKPEYQKMAGKRINQLTGYKWHGLIQNGDDLMASSQYSSGPFGLGDCSWIDFNGDGTIDGNDMIPMGYSQQYPLYSYSLSAGFEYKGFELDFMFQGVEDVTRWGSDSFEWPLHRLSTHLYEFQLDAWSPYNRDARFAAFHTAAYRDANNNNITDGTMTSNNMFDASFIRLKTVNIAYTLPKKVVGKIGLNSLKIYLRGNNLFTWAPGYPIGDPEVSDSGGNVNTGRYPLIRRFLLGLQLSF